jgi:hypothetical protein
MGEKLHPGWALGAALCLGLLAEAVEARPGPDCGEEIRTRDVLVLDLEDLRNNPERAREFVAERAGEFRLLTTRIEEIRTRARPSKDPDSVIRRARKLGAEHGCDLVLVLKTGPYFGRQRGRMARIRDHGYAFVVMGQRIEGSETHH